MRFSEAMLLGLPEIRFTNAVYLDWNSGDDGHRCQGCLFGAALFAMGERKSDCASPSSLADYQIQKFWPWLTKLPANKLCCWCCPAEFGSIQHFVTHLANHYVTGRLSATEIAAYFDRIDPTPKQDVEKEQEHETHEVQRSDVVRVAGD